MPLENKKRVTIWELHSAPGKQRGGYDLTVTYSDIDGQLFLISHIHFNNSRTTALNIIMGLSHVIHVCNKLCHDDKQLKQLMLSLTLSEI